MNIKHSLEKSKYADASAKKKIIMQKSISNNIVNSDWEKNKKNSIKDIYEKKFQRIDTPKKTNLMNQASVLFGDSFYQNNCQGKKKINLFFIIFRF